MVMELPGSLTLIFDGRCGMCTRTISWIARHDPEQRIVVTPCQSNQTLERFGVSRDQCTKSIWAVTPKGERIPAGQAAVLVLAVLMQQRWILTFGQLPGVRQVLEVGYAIVARNRRRFPGITPWCESHPNDCSEPERS